MYSWSGINTSLLLKERLSLKRLYSTETSVPQKFECSYLIHWTSEYPTAKWREEYKYSNRVDGSCKSWLMHCFMNEITDKLIKASLVYELDII